MPIKANDKEPLFAWGTMPSDAMWYAAGGSEFRGNIATILGNGFAVIDCDDTSAIEHVNAWLDGKGISASKVRTPSGGVHAWLRVSHAPDEINYRNLSPDIGDGELRVSNCYVLAPCSSIGNQRYIFEIGSPEAIASQRAVRWQDLLELLPGRVITGNQITSLPVRLLRREMPIRAAQLFALLRDAPEGISVERYSSRSEAEAAIVAMLILSGWDLSDISQVFEAEMPAHHAESKHRERYLEQTYRNVLSNIANTPERLHLAELYHQASEQAWHGRGGLLDLAVLRAIIAIGYQYATYTPNASVRDIAEHASASLSGVHGGVARLCERGYLSRLQPGNKARAALWQIIPSRYSNISHIINNIALNAQIEQIADDCNDDGIGDKSAINNKIDADIAELWGQSCLGRSSYAVYLRLSQDGKSIRDLSKQTGKSWHTVRDALKRLELHDLAYSHAHLWFVGIGSVPVVAEEFDADQLAARRHARHEREREAWLYARSRG